MFAVILIKTKIMYTVIVNFKSGKNYTHYNIDKPKYYMAKIYGTNINNCAVNSIRVNNNYIDLDEIEKIAENRGW